MTTIASPLNLNSLRARLLLSAALVLAAFGSLTGLILERSFNSGLSQAQQDKMQTLIYALLGAASEGADGNLTIDLQAVPDPRLRQPLSGLEAALLDEQGRLVWQSTGLLAAPDPHPVAVGEWFFQRLRQPDAFSLRFGLRWIDGADDPRRYSIVIIENAASYIAQLHAFRRTLWLWLSLTLLALTLTQLLLLHWGLLPLRRLTRELRQIEQGQQTQIQGHYPIELRPLTRDLNAMISAERHQQTRYRNALGDLAHTLKTPLAVLRGLEAEAPPEVQEQVDRMLHIVDHQLRRAAAAGTRTLTEPIGLRALTDKISAALCKVYADQSIRIENHIPSTLRLRIDQGDLYELIGNLLDNAAKYGNGKVRIRARANADHHLIEVEDNGGGFPDNTQALLERGVRADTRAPGQGLGLAAVSTIVEACQGQLQLARSVDLGGGKVSVRLPLR